MGFYGDFNDVLHGFNWDDHGILMGQQWICPLVC